MEYKRLKKLINHSNHILLACHARPDGDAIGSMLALQEVLIGLGKQTLAVSPTRMSTMLQTLPHADRISIFDDNAAEVLEFLTRTDLVILLDLNDPYRLDDNLAEALLACPAPRVIIDHHQDPKTDYFALTISQTASSSTCELLTDIIRSLYGDSAVTTAAAQNLYSGIATDTGNFAYSCHGNTFRTAGWLLDHGVDQARVRKDFYGSFRESRMRLYAYAVYEKMQLFANGRAAIIGISAEDLTRFDFRPGDTEGLANEPLSIAGVSVSALLLEHRFSRLRISFRSRDGIRVDGLARSHFNGGGHAYAAGGSLRMDLEQAIHYTQEKVLNWLTEHQQG